MDNYEEIVPNDPRAGTYNDPENGVYGQDLCGWGSVTCKPFSVESIAATSTGQHVNYDDIRPAGACNNRQWSKAPSNNTTTIGLTIRTAGTTHTYSSGVLVKYVTNGSPAAYLGFKEHDIITSINGQQTLTVQQFYKAYGQFQGQRMEFLLNRDGQRGVAIVHDDTSNAPQQEEATAGAAE